MSDIMLHKNVHFIGIGGVSMSSLAHILLNNGVIDEKSARLIMAAVGNNALKAAPPEYRDSVRAGIFKQILINII